MSGAPDEADMHKAGTLSSDPKAGTRVVAAQVPRVANLSDMLTGARKRVFAKESRSFCTTGHYRLDQITGGIRPGYSWLIGADTSFGKSSWLIAVTDINIDLGKRVLIVSSEDTEELYADRLMIRRSGVNAIRFRDKELTPEEADLVVKAEQQAKPIPVYVDARKWVIEDLIPHLRTIIKEHKIDVVAFDYVQEFKTKRRYQDERIKFREIASSMRHLAKDAKIAALIFSQLTLSENTTIPTRANIRECKDMANGSEVILIGFETKKQIDVPGKQPIPADTKCFLVDKCKDGPRGAKIPMDWYTEVATFRHVKAPVRSGPPRNDEFDDVGEPPPDWRDGR
jgi:replicative DNA helicase